MKFFSTTVIVFLTILLAACHEDVSVATKTNVALPLEHKQPESAQEKKAETRAAIKVIPDGEQQSPESRDLARRQALKQFQDARDARK